MLNSTICCFYGVHRSESKVADGHVAKCFSLDNSGQEESFKYRQTRGFRYNHYFEPMKFDLFFFLVHSLEVVRNTVSGPDSTRDFLSASIVCIFDRLEGLGGLDDEEGRTHLLSTMQEPLVHSPFLSIKNALLPNFHRSPGLFFLVLVSS